MKIIDRGVTMEIADDDPRAARIRLTLLESPGPADPIATLWRECTDDHRAVLLAIAKAGEISQIELEDELGVNAVELRGRHGGIAKIAKRLGAEYPIRSVGSRRAARRFSLDREAAARILKLNNQSTTKRGKR